ncbi:MAG: GIY-YIG nuclease family protein [Anaerolineae bacterium]
MGDPPTESSSPMSDLPAEPGLYVLLLSLREDRSFAVRGGRRFALPAGAYAYVGSARGPGGLPARLARHLRHEKPCHWHIDFAMQAAVPLGFVCVAPSLEECQLAGLVAGLPGAAPVAGFGCSDCRCGAHLYALPAPLSPSALAEALRHAAAAAGLSLTPRGTWSPGAEAASAR